MDQSIQRIVELPKSVADKIAAGEVVDRPLSIVKELVENSIDAGATSVTVEIRNGGKTYIRITDNGSGIRKEEVELAFKRHATSKIKTASDLDHIISLGFRGEALASIAAVSRVELITKTAGEKSGIRMKLEGGEILEKEDTGCPEGTTFIIEDLFFNTPARLKFMKQDATESTLIIDFISKMTLAYPQIKFRLINNGNILFSTNGKGDIYSNILTIYSREIGDKLIRLSEDNGQMSLEAFVSAPNNSRTNRKSQIFFVNGRYISSRIMENAVADAYQEKLFEGRYPVAFLFLRVAPESIDVNIHPNKREVRFDDDKAVREFISSAIRKSLKTKEAIPEIKENTLFKFKPQTSGSAVTPDSTAGSEQSKSTDVKSTKQTEEQVDIKKLLFEQRLEEQRRKQGVVSPKPVSSNDLGGSDHKTGAAESRSVKTLADPESSMDWANSVDPSQDSQFQLNESQERYSTNDTKAVGAAQLQTTDADSGFRPESGSESGPTGVNVGPAGLNAGSDTRLEVGSEAGNAVPTSGARLKYIVLENTQTEQAKPAVDFDINSLTVTGSVFGTYITAVDDSSLYLIDQHAAHERIFYEQLLEEYRKEEKTQQLILTPYVIHVTHAVKNDTGGMLHFLGNLGFEIEEFGPTSYIVKAIPYYMDLEESKDFIDYLLDNISEEGDLDNQKKIAAIITNACKKAVKAHDVLDRREIERLMADLARTKNPYSCPHGRPTFVRLRKYEIEKMFKRV